MKHVFNIIAAALLLVFFGGAFFVYSYGEKLTQQGFMRGLNLWLLVILLHLINIVVPLLF